MKANITGRTAVANAISSALYSVQSNGILMVEIASTANRHFKGEEIPADDITAIANNVGDSQGWKGKTLTARVSEVRVILRACDKLPKYLEAMKKAVGDYSWHDAMKLARRANKGDSVAAAVAFVKNNKVTSQSSVNPQGRAAGALSQLYGSVKGERRDAVRKAIKMLKDAGVIKVSDAMAEKVGL